MNKLYLFFSCILVLLFFNGCIEFQEYIKIKKDGSALVEFSYSISEKDFAIFSSFESILLKSQNLKPARKQLPRIFDEKSIKNYLKLFQGTELITFRTFKKDKRRYAFISLEVKNLSKSLKKGLLGNIIFVQDKEKNYIIELPLKLSKFSFSNKKELLKGLNLKLRIETPGKIITSSAQKESDHTAVWEISEKNVASFFANKKKFYLKFSGAKLLLLKSKK